jgi:hypothetical protein
LRNSIGKPTVGAQQQAMDQMSLYILNIFIITLAVLVHYEFLYHATRLIPKMRIPPRFRIMFGVGMALMAHTVEVWIFALAYLLMIRYGYGTLEGSFTGTLLDCVYFSFATFSTLGFGDIYPVGDIRYLTGLSSMTGMVLVSWTASFLYFEMQRLWTGH